MGEMSDPNPGPGNAKDDPADASAIEIMLESITVLARNQREFAEALKRIEIDLEKIAVRLDAGARSRAGTGTAAEPPVITERAVICGPPHSSEESLLKSIETELRSATDDQMAKGARHD